MLRSRCCSLIEPSWTLRKTSDSDSQDPQSSDIYIVAGSRTLFGGTEPKQQVADVLPRLAAQRNIDQEGHAPRLSEIRKWMAPSLRWFPKRGRATPAREHEHGGYLIVITRNEPNQIIGASHRNRLRYYTSVLFFFYLMDLTCLLITPLVDCLALHSILLLSRTICIWLTKFESASDLRGGVHSNNCLCLYR